MPTRLLLLCFAALTLLSGAWLVLGGEEVTLPPQDADFVDGTFDHADMATAEAAASRDRDAIDLDHRELERDEIERSDDAGLTTLATEGLIVMVMRPDPVANLKHVPGIEVAWVGVREGEQRAEQLPKSVMRPRSSEHPRLFGRKSRTGEEGTIRLPPVTEPIWVSAADEATFAINHVDPGTRQVVLVLLPDETLTIFVGDSHGRGVAEAPLTIQKWIQDRGPEERWTGKTDKLGQCLVRHFQLVPGQHSKGERFAVAVTAPQLQPSWLEFQARPAPKEPLRLTLVGTRPLSVQVVHKSGAPILASLHVSLWSQRPPTDDVPWGSLLPATFERLGQRKPRGSDPILFPHVGCGTKLRPFLQIPGERAPRKLPEIALPDEASSPDLSKPFQLTLTLPEDLVVLAMQPHGSDGEPLQMAEIPWQLRRQLGPGLSGSLETIEDGRADFIVPARMRGPESSASPEPYDASPLVLMLRETLAPELVLGAEKAIGSLRAGERRDLGPIVMAPLPLLCKGRVTDDRGEPRKGAQVLVAVAVAVPQGEHWIPAPHLQKQTADDGTFAIYASTPHFPFRLQTQQDNEHFEAISEPLSPGAHVELVTTRVGILQGRVIPPPGLPENALTLTLIRDPAEIQEGKKQRPAQTPIRRKNGWFWLGNLQPGTYSAIVTMRGIALPLAHFQGVRIAPGPNEDPRLLPLDVSQSLFCYSIRAVGPGGQPMPALEGPILWRGRLPDGSPQFTAFRWQNGAATFFLPVPFAELVIVGPGIRATEVAVTPQTRDVVVDPIVPFPVELPGVRSLAGPTRAIRVSAVFLGETGLPQGIGGQDQTKGEGFSFPRNQLGKAGGGWLDVADRTGLVVSRSGSYELTLRLYEGDAREGRQAAMPLGNHEVDVDGRTLRPLVLPIDLQHVQRLLDSMRPQNAPGQNAPQRPSRR